jgi:hypothetical protein
MRLSIGRAVADAMKTVKSTIVHQRRSGFSSAVYLE